MLVGKGQVGRAVTIGSARGAIGCSIAAVVLLRPVCVEANAGLPMIVVALPGMAVALIPIVLVEALVLASRLRARWWPCAKFSLVANLVSSFLGLPLTWFLLVVVQMLTGGGDAYGLGSRWHRFIAVTWQAPWLIPYESDLPWMIPSAALALLIPFFFASVLVQYHVIRRMLPTTTHTAIRRGVLLANTWSYAGLAAVLVVRLALTRQ